jgi:hypothetical protein
MLFEVMQEYACNSRYTLHIAGIAMWMHALGEIDAQ